MATNPFEIFHIHAEKVQKWRSAPVYQYYVRRFDKPEFSKGPFGDEAAATREVCGQIRDMLQAEIDHLEAKLHDLEEWGGWCPNCACIHCQQKHEDSQ